jgi:integrase
MFVGCNRKIRCCSALIEILESAYNGVTSYKSDGLIVGKGEAQTKSGSNKRVKLTAGRINDFACSEGAAQTFLWDSDVPGLAIRATPNSARKVFVFQSKLAGKSLRKVIGDVTAWGIDQARVEARRLQTLVDQGKDPRDEHRAQEEARVLKRREAKRAEVLARQAWDAYIEARQVKWSARTLADHQAVTKPGGEVRTRGRRDGKTVTEPGALVGLLSCKLADLTAERVGDWLVKEVERRPTQAALAFRMLRAFVRWAAERNDYAGIIPADACAKREVREQVPTVRAKQDALLREQLPGWFKGVREIANPVVSAYLQALLLTGARREELAGLQWVDVDFRWKHLTIRDKEETKRRGEGEGFRIIPLTPYVATLLNALPRRVQEIDGKKVENPWVFSSPAAASGRLQDPREGHVQACKLAGIERLTFHGLRRSFGSLAEWVEMPSGVIAQIQGHKPSATAEKHYRVRPVDLLAQYHNTYEAWILGQAGIEFDAGENTVPLRAVGR